jgi:CheY-like chemotaxis protein
MKDGKILIVDDEPAIRKLFELVFTKQGYAVGAAESAEEALQLMENDSFPVMFFDLNLPGMNGIDLCRHVKKDNPRAIVYAITGYTSMFELTDCREVGFDDYFTKPANVSDLIKAAADGFAKNERWACQSLD